WRVWRTCGDLHVDDGAGAVQVELDEPAAARIPPGGEPAILDPPAHALIGQAERPGRLGEQELHTDTSTRHTPRADQCGAPWRAWRAWRIKPRWANGGPRGGAQPRGRRQPGRRGHGKVGPAARTTPGAGADGRSRLASRVSRLVASSLTGVRPVRS